MHNKIVKQLMIEDIEDSISKIFKSASTSTVTPFELTIYFVIKVDGTLVTQTSNFQILREHPCIQTIPSTILNDVEKYFNQNCFKFRDYRLQCKKKSKTALKIKFVMD